MRTVVGFPSYSSIATWTNEFGTWDPDFPVTNVGDLLRLRRVTKATSTGVVEIGFQLAAPQMINLVSLIHHNLLPDCIVNVALYSDNAFADIVLGIGGISPPPAVGNLPQTFPVLLADAPVAVMSGLINMTPAGTEPLPILGAIDIAQAYIWKDVTVPQQRGFAPSGQRLAQPGGTDANMRQWSPRTFTGERDVVTRAEIESTILDFQSHTRLSQPFVFVRDIDDPNTWAREAYLARNKPLANSTVNEPENGKHAFTFQEHLG